MMIPLPSCDDMTPETRKSCCWRPLPGKAAGAWGTLGTPALSIAKAAAASERPRTSEAEEGGVFMVTKSKVLPAKSEPFQYSTKDCRSQAPASFLAGFETRRHYQTKS